MDKRIRWAEDADGIGETVRADMTWEEWKRSGRLGNNGIGDIIRYGKPIMPSLGAKPSNYPVVENPFTGEQLRFVVGSIPEFPPDQTMARKGCKTGREIDEIDEIDEIADFYKTDKIRWQKEKARYQTYDENEDIRMVELHWYQHPDIGKVEYKVKLDERGRMYVDER